MKKTILLLGGSTQQVIAIERAKELGYRTVLCDYLPDNPGQYKADVFYQVSTTDVDAVYEVANKEHVDGILPYSSDPAALPAAIVSERLGLPTNPAKSVEILGLKYRFREFLKENGFPCPNFFKFTSDDSLDDVISNARKLSFPIVLKPTDSSGSKGISVIDSISKMEGAVEAAKKYSRNGIFVCEEYIKRGYPYIIEVELFVLDGKISLISYTVSLRDKKKGLLPLGYLWSSDIPDSYKEKINDSLQRIIDKLDIQFGEMNVELIINQYEEVQFIEIGPRAGGNMIPVVLSDAFKCDLPELQIRCALGEKPVIPDTTIDGKYCIYVIHTQQKGIFNALHISDEVVNFVYRIHDYKKIGDEVEPYENAWNAIGMAFLHFPDSRTANELYPKLEELIKPVITATDE